MTNTTKNRIALLVLFLTFEAALIGFKIFQPQLIMTPFEWVILVFAASLIGASVAYMAIGEWFRWPLTKVVRHSCGEGESVEPSHEGFLKAPGILLACPICAGTWGAMILVGVMALAPDFGRYLLYVLGAGGAVRLVVRISELIEWSSRLKWEQTGYWNRRNKLEVRHNHLMQQTNNNGQYKSTLFIDEADQIPLDVFEKLLE
jgi:hypothetical protein